MKRWTTLLGRVGTVLIAISLALLLVSLFPSAQLTTSGFSTAIPPKWVQSFTETILTPQQGLRITIAANGTLDVYILEVSSLDLYQWVAEIRARALDDFLNVTDLEEFLAANPSLIGWYDEVSNGRIEHEYVPTKVTNATLVFSNPSSEYVSVDCEASKTSRIAPGTKVRNLALWTTPIGLILTIPWLAEIWKHRKHI
jgi:hypothetical protein